MSVNDLKRSTPERQGVLSSGILAFLEELERRNLELHGFMFLRHNHVIAEGWWDPYKPEYPHAEYSLTKSFTSTAVGLAVSEGLISVDDTVLKYFPEFDNEDVRRNMGGMTIKHLLTMSTGHTEDTTRFDIEASFLQDRPDVGIGKRKDNDWTRGFFELPIKRPTGTYFVYNSGASHLLAMIVQRVTSQNLLDYLYLKLFIPLGIEKPSWDTSPLGNISGGWGLRLKTEDIARFGQMLLNKGIWNGKRILSESWIEEATKKQVETVNNLEQQSVKGAEDGVQGYGYHFWMCRHNAYRGDGAFGQFCIVIPDKDAVIAINSGVADMQGVLDTVWNNLLPAMHEREAQIDETAGRVLQYKLASLSIGEKNNLGHSALTGTRKYRIEPNEDQVDEISLTFDNRNCIFAWSATGEKQSINAGIGEWNLKNRLADENTVAKGVWRDENTFVIDLCRIYTPFHDRVECSFNGDILNIYHRHIDFIMKERRLVGKLQK